MDSESFKEFSNAVKELNESIEEKAKAFMKAAQDLHEDLERLGQFKSHCHDSYGRARCLKWRNLVRSLGINLKALAYACDITTGRKKALNPRSLYNIAKPEENKPKRTRRKNAPGSNAMYEYSKNLRRSKAALKQIIDDGKFEESREEVAKELEWAVNLKKYLEENL